MKACLHCLKEYEPKRETSKFCSTSCRVGWYQKHSKGKDKVKIMDMKEMFNAVMSAVNSINAKNGQPEAFGAVFEVVPENQSRMDYSGAKATIEISTSAAQLEDAWRQIKKQEWAGWQMKELERLKELQQTKIDF